MTKYHPENERIKKKYFEFEKEARQQSEATIDAIAKAIVRFEDYTRHRDFRLFHVNQATGFKQHLGTQTNVTSGKPLSKSTMVRTLTQLRDFFRWLSQQPGYKRLAYLDAEYFNPSLHDLRRASASRPKKVPTIEQIRSVIGQMPESNDIQRRDRALVAFILLTGARDSAVASMSLKHVDLDSRCVYQDAREVKTKFRKSFSTYFFPVGEPFEAIVGAWVTYLRTELLYGNDDPLFPATAVQIGENREFEASGLKREHWQSAGPIRAVFKKAFGDAGLPYFNPHVFRDTLAHLGQQRCQSPEHFKAWSQNLGHEQVMTTLTNYGEVSERRQKEILTSLDGDEKFHNEGSLRAGLKRLLEGETI